MKKQMTITVNGKSYLISYEKDGNTYRLDTNHADLIPHVTPNFFFKILDGKAQYLVVSDKTHQIARQIIKQINENEFK